MVCIPLLDLVNEPASVTVMEGDKMSVESKLEEKSPGWWQIWIGVPLTPTETLSTVDSGVFGKVITCLLTMP